MNTATAGSTQTQALIKEAKADRAAAEASLSDAVDEIVIARIVAAVARVRYEYADYQIRRLGEAKSEDEIEEIPDFTTWVLGRIQVRGEDLWRSIHTALRANHSQDYFLLRELKDQLLTKIEPAVNNHPDLKGLPYFELGVIDGKPGYRDGQIIGRFVRD